MFIATKDSMETFFKSTFYLAVFVCIFLVIGLFLLIIKITLLFTPEIHFLGIKFSQGIAHVLTG